jgi:hypothetical protein
MFNFNSIFPTDRSASAEVHLAVVGDEEEGEEVTTTLTARRETSRGTRPTWSAMSKYLLVYYLLLVASLYPLT